MFTLDWFVKGLYKVELQTYESTPIETVYEIYNCDNRFVSIDLAIAVTHLYANRLFTYMIQFYKTPTNEEDTIVYITHDKRVLKVVVSSAANDAVREYSAKKYIDAWQKKLAPLLTVIDKIAP